MGGFPNSDFDLVCLFVCSQITNCIIFWVRGNLKKISSVFDTPYRRYYEKSIIKEEIEEQRSLINNNWDETKKSIKEARYRISMEMEEFTKKRVKCSLQSLQPLTGTNGTSP